MIRFLLAMATLGVAATAVEAAVLTPEAALRRALASEAAVAKLPAASADAPRLTLTRMADDDAAAVYLFAKSDGGYYVVAADDVAEPLLGYSDSGSPAADPAAMPPALLYWLDEYAREIAWARANGVVALSPSPAAADRAPIAPLLSTRWNQDEPYNDLCPEINGKRCPAGCVAIAMAQVMNYHSWPVQGTGSSSYAWGSDETILSADYGATTYDWANMADSYSSATTAAERAAVATLAYHCGVACEMSYGPDASSAKNYSMQRALVTYFDYNPDIYMMDRDCYTIGEWADSVYRQLTAYGPLVYRGDSDDGGHAFVCDGYSSDGYFHINWGWGGASNGYFLLNALNPSMQGIGGGVGGYNTRQSIVAGVKKDEGEAIGFHLTSQRLIADAESVALGQMVHFQTGSYNHGASKATGCICLLATNMATGETQRLARFKAELESNYGYSGMNFTIPGDLAEGTYTLMLGAADANGDNERPMVRALNAQTLVTMVVEGATATFVNGDVPSVAASGVKVAGGFYVGMPVGVAATVANQSATTPYTGRIRGYLFDSDTGSAVGLGEALVLDLAAGESREIVYTTAYTDTDGGKMPAGDYLLALVAGNVVVSEAVGVTISPASYSLTMAAAPAVAESPAYADAFTVKATVANAKGYYYGPFCCTLYIDGGDGYLYSRNSFSTGYVAIDGGASVELTFSGSYEDATVGETYYLLLTDKDYKDVPSRLTGKRLFGKVVFAQRPSAGIAEPSHDGSGAAASTTYYTLTGRRVGEDAALAPGIYVKVERLADGTMRTAKVAVP